MGTRKLLRLVLGPLLLPSAPFLDFGPLLMHRYHRKKGAKERCPAWKFPKSVALDSISTSEYSDVFKYMLLNPD